MSLKKIVSGGQTGADIAGIDAAIANGFSYGGWLPKGRKTEDGTLDEKYKMEAMKIGGYPKRTEQNVKDSNGTVIFTHGRLTGGSKKTADYAESWGKPWLHFNMIDLSTGEAVVQLREWIAVHVVEVLNVAGSRASKDAEIYGVTFEVIGKVIRSF